MKFSIIVFSLVFSAVTGLSCTQTDSTPSATSQLAPLETVSATPGVTPPAATSTESPSDSPAVVRLDPTRTAGTVPVATSGPMPTTGSSPIPPLNLEPFTKQVVEAYVLEGRSLTRANLNGLELSGASATGGFLWIRWTK